MEGQAFLSFNPAATIWAEPKFKQARTIRSDRYRCDGEEYFIAAATAIAKYYFVFLAGAFARAS